MKRLAYEDLLNMEGQCVRVEDEINNYHNQECIVNFFNHRCGECSNTYITISLENEAYSFDYDKDGNCLDGRFDVYKIEN